MAPRGLFPAGNLPRLHCALDYGWIYVKESLAGGSVLFTGGSGLNIAIMMAIYQAQVYQTPRAADERAGEVEAVGRLVSLLESCET